LASVVAPPPRFAYAWKIALAPLAGLAIAGLVGWWRLGAVEVGYVPGVVLRLVQPNIAQADKWRPSLREQHLMEYIRLSIPEPGSSVSHVIWGEAAVAFALDRDEPHRRLAAGAVPRNGALIAGVTRADRSERGVEAIYNSLIAIDGEARVTAVYDKVNLVPFGEFLPLRGLIPFQKLTQGTMDFSAGRARTAITVTGLPPFSPLICYEAVFSGDVAGDGGRPGWLLNLTNDSWFGDSTGPRQHLAAARLRAVEEGLPLIRVANTGITAAIDPYGRVISQLALGARGVLDVALPRPSPAATPFGLSGNFPTLLALLLITGGLFSQRLRRLFGRRP
jgi:apolipoprotein N-acyltransferase